jgi:hypothetical protein
VILGAIEDLVGRHVEDRHVARLAGEDDVVGSEGVYGQGEFGVTSAAIHVGHGRQVHDGVWPGGLHSRGQSLGIRNVDGIDIGWDDLVCGEGGLQGAAKLALGAGKEDAH